MKTKDYNFKTVDIKGKKYVEVAERLKYLSENEDYEIQTDYQLIGEMFIVKATLKIYSEIGGNARIFTGLAQEIIGDSFINKTSALENAETSAVGRACAMAGIGIIDAIASVDEITKAKNRDVKKPELKSYTKQYEDVVKALAQGYTIEQVEKKYYLTDDMKKRLL